MNQCRPLYCAAHSNQRVNSEASQHHKTHKRTCREHEEQPRPSRWIFYTHYDSWHFHCCRRYDADCRENHHLLYVHQSNSNKVKLTNDTSLQRLFITFFIFIQTMFGRDILPTLTLCAHTQILYIHNTLKAMVACQPWQFR